MARTRWASAMALALIAVVAPPSFGGKTTRVSVDSNGREGQGHSIDSVLSWDGRWVAFSSTASLVADDTNGVSDVYVHDRLTGATTRVSVNSSGEQGNADSGYQYKAGAVDISADGRYIAFPSKASNLVPGDTNDRTDAFVHDLQTHVTTRVSVSSSGAQGDGASGEGRVYLSANGLVVGFPSAATNLVPGDTNSNLDVFVHDRTTGMTSRVSVDSRGVQGDGMSSGGKPNGDGSVVTFHSRATNLVAGDRNGKLDVFVHDRITRVTTRASVASDGTEGNGDSFGGWLSDDGRRLVFTSEASNLVSVDQNGDLRDAFLHDLASGETSLVNVDPNGRQSEMINTVSISANGEVVTFSTYYDVFVRDLASHHTMFVCTTIDGEKANANADRGALSGDGRICVFDSGADNLVPGDTNGWDVFVHERARLECDGVPTNPNPVRFLTWQSERRNLVVVLLSGTGFDGFVLGKRRVPLTLDALTRSGLGCSTFLAAMADDDGNTQTASFTFPAIPPGTTFFAASISIDQVTGALESITAPITIVTQ